MCGKISSKEMGEWQQYRRRLGDFQAVLLTGESLFEEEQFSAAGTAVLSFKRRHPVPSTASQSQRLKNVNQGTKQAVGAFWE